MCKKSVQHEFRKNEVDFECVPKQVIAAPDLEQIQGRNVDIVALSISWSMLTLYEDGVSKNGDYFFRSQRNAAADNGSEWWKKPLHGTAARSALLHPFSAHSPQTLELFPTGDSSAP